MMANQSPVICSFLVFLTLFNAASATSQKGADHKEHRGVVDCTSNKDFMNTEACCAASHIEEEECGKDKACFWNLINDPMGNPRK